MAGFSEFCFSDMIIADRFSEMLLASIKMKLGLELQPQSYHLRRLLLRASGEGSLLRRLGLTFRDE
jgi:hypothetical protein